MCNSTLTPFADKEITDSGIAIRVYTPTNANNVNGLPVGVFAHGGGHINGGAWSSSFEDRMCRYVSHHASVIVAQVDFRLAPEHPVPAQLNDVFDAYKWVIPSIFSNYAVLCNAKYSFSAIAMHSVCMETLRASSPLVLRSVEVWLWV